ncbi:MAG: RnfABCDGE type electron transport complex subunit D [Lentisphaeria bacterium]|nr:RnfABCDGE type electron transport complex subunit D [Lentisphaeria bacterium]
MPETTTKKTPVTKKAPAFKRQKVMEKVLLALSPAAVGAVYFFGWRTMAMTLWVMGVACVTEYLLAKRRGDPLTGSCLVTGALLGLALPPTLPFWMGAVGAVVGVAFGKELFGGFGRNVFNPAIVGRAFLYVSFPEAMTKWFIPAFQGGPGGLLSWGGRRTMEVNGEVVDALTAATPMWFRRDIGFPETFTFWDQIKQLFSGGIGGVFEGADGGWHILAAGSAGEVSALLLLVGGIYLLVTKTANWRLVASSFAGAAGASLIFRHVLGAAAVPPVLFTLFSGAMVYACFFMVTDPVSAPKNKQAQLWYGAFIGMLIVFFRWKAVFAGGVAFAILLGNTVGPTLDLIFKARADKKKAKTAAKPAAAEGA